MSDFKEVVYDVLSSNENYLDENNNLINGIIINDSIKNDEKLLKLLLNNEITKNHFFNFINDCLIFNKEKFITFISMRFLSNSYTSFKNKIGLNINGNYLNEIDDVSLFWPYKDCILEGGMSYDDQKNRNEIFFNETLAKYEIDRLLEPKVLTNFNSFGNIKFQQPQDILNNNLLIKGNNLLVLHSLLPSFKNRIKLIYIDPPYNTKGAKDTFTYNNNFKESTWLTFMKNRLEVAKDLLSDDGFVAIAINHVELFYLGILADEIFGRENRIGLITVVHKPEGVQKSKFFSPSNEFMLVYAKNKNLASFNNVIIDEKKKYEFNQKDENGNFKWINFIRGDSNKNNYPNRFYPIYVSEDLKEISLEKKDDFIKVLPIKNGKERTWNTKKETFLKYLENNEIRAILNKDNKINIEWKSREKQRFVTHWCGKRYNATANGTNRVNNHISGQKVSYPKSIYTVLDTLKIMTKENDIILDFFSGSGTTAHATFCLNKEDGGNRQVILVEQLDQHNNVAIEFLSNIIEEEQYNDGFIYCELMKYNQKAIDRLYEINNSEDLLKLWDKFVDEYFLNYDLNISKFNENIEKFKALTLEEQKRCLFDLLNKNQLYVNLSEIDDVQFNVSDEEKLFNKHFYNNNGGL